MPKPSLNNHKEKQMLKHIGRHGDRKVAIVFREIPGEEHMCLVVYPDVLPTHIHNTVMKVLESAPGQQSTNLADVLHRNLLPDGRPILNALHHEGMLKKIASSQVILTPTPTTSAKLDEINRLVKEMESGAEALKKLQQLDQNAGIVAPETKREQEREFKRRRLEQEAEAARLNQPAVPADANSALDDKTLASNMLSQAKRMEAEAQGLIAEAARMKKDAERMFPGVMPAQNTVQLSSPEPKKRGRTSKRVAADASVQ
jgi:hypothetical protein